MAEKTNITKDTPPDMIERDIVRTRVEMGETVSEIQERLSPSHLKEHAREKFRGKMRDTASRISHTAKGTGNTILNTVKNNPVPVAMMSVGFAWLLYNRSHDGNGRYISEKASSLQEKAGELTGQVRETGRELAGKAKTTAGRFGRVAQERAHVAKNRFQQTIHDNPFGVVLAAFAIGASVGFIIPETGKEKEMMGVGQ